MENTHSVSLNGETILVNLDNFRANVDALVARHGGGVPKVQTLVDDVQPAPAPAEVVTAPASTPAPVRGVTVDAAGAARSEQDSLAAKLAGFSPKPPIYTRGTMVVDLGVDNARLSRLEHDKKPLVEEACMDLVQRIRDEKRIDHRFAASDLRMSNEGRLMAPFIVGGELNPLGFPTERTFRALVNRLGIGGADYLSRCPAKLRATNLNNWVTGRDGLPMPEGEIKLRTRRHPSNGREVFAAVSPKYTSFDCDRIALELRTAIQGTGARGSVVYDGDRMRAEAIWHTDVQPEEFVAGEFFKAGIIVTSADDGSGSCRVSACVWQNLCLNLIIIDEAEEELARIRHVGSEQRISSMLRQAFDAAQDKVGYFVKKWGGACREDLVKQAANLSKVPYSIEEIIPGYFNGVIERDLVPVRGKRQDVVRALVEMNRKDESSATRHGFTRAALANAFTRYAHEVNADTWQEDAIQRAAGALVQSTEPLPFEPITLEG